MGDEQGFTAATTVLFPCDADWPRWFCHGPNYFDNNRVRAVVQEFVTSQTVTDSLDGCDEGDDGVWVCARDGEQTCTTSYVLNENTTQLVCDETTSTIINDKTTSTTSNDIISARIFKLTYIAVSALFLAVHTF